MRRNRLDDPDNAKEYLTPSVFRMKYGYAKGNIPPTPPQWPHKPSEWVPFLHQDVSRYYLQPPSQAFYEKYDSKTSREAPNKDHKFISPDKDKDKDFPNQLERPTDQGLVRITESYDGGKRKSVNLLANVNDDAIQTRRKFFDMDEPEFCKEFQMPAGPTVEVCNIVPLYVRNVASRVA